MPDWCGAPPDPLADRIRLSDAAAEALVMRLGVVGALIGRAC